MKISLAVGKMKMLFNTGSRFPISRNARKQNDELGYFATDLQGLLPNGRAGSESHKPHTR
jgi:hypothetical protein